jgi:hypothetical protein
MSPQLSRSTNLLSCHCLLHEAEHRARALKTYDSWEAKPR